MMVINGPSHRSIVDSIVDNDILESEFELKSHYFIWLLLFNGISTFLGYSMPNPSF